MGKAPLVRNSANKQGMPLSVITGLMASPARCQVEAVTAYSMAHVDNIERGGSIPPNVVTEVNMTLTMW